MVVAAGRAEASVVFDITQVGSNVVITGSGTLDLNGLTPFEYSTYAPQEVVPSYNTIIIGGTPPSGAIDIYSGITTSPGSLGSGGTTPASSGTGDETFGIDDMVLDVPAGYMSGEALSGSSTFDDTTIASLGFMAGTYVFSLGQRRRRRSRRRQYHGPSRPSRPGTLDLGDDVPRLRGPRLSGLPEAWGARGRVTTEKSRPRGGFFLAPLSAATANAPRRRRAAPPRPPPPGGRFGYSGGRRERLY